jgi:L-fucose isomerase
VIVNAWFSSNILIGALQKLNKPIFVLEMPYEDTNAITGVACFRGGLNEIGIKNIFFYGDLKDERIKREIINFSTAAAVVKKLTESKYGFLGGQSLGMYTTMFDYAQMKRVFGIEPIHEDQLKIVTVAKSLPQGLVNSKKEEIKNNFRIENVDEEQLEKSVRVYLALKAIVEENKYNFVGVKCQPEMIDNYCSCCLALSLLTDDGIPAACECDTNGALSMYVLSLLSGCPSYFGDIVKIDTHNNLLCTANCGCAATKLSSGSTTLHKQYDWMGKAGGVVTCFVCKEGEVTLLRFFRVEGNYRMLISKANTIESKDLLPTKEYWPHAFIKLSDADSVDRFIRNVNSNHIHFTYGNYLEQLKYIGLLLDTTVVEF